MRKRLVKIGKETIAAYVVMRCSLLQVLLEYQYIFSKFGNITQHGKPEVAIKHQQPLETFLVAYFAAYFTIFQPSCLRQD